MIRTLWHRMNLWSWLRRLEGVMVQHMAELSAQRRVNQAQNTLNKAQTSVINQLHQRVTRLEAAANKDHVVRIFPGPYSDHGKEQC
jgi:hypothetical protein